MTLYGQELLLLSKTSKVIQKKRKIYSKRRSSGLKRKTSETSDFKVRMLREVSRSNLYDFKGIRFLLWNHKQIR